MSIDNSSIFIWFEHRKGFVRINQTLFIYLFIYVCVEVSSLWILFSEKEKTPVRWLLIENEWSQKLEFEDPPNISDHTLIWILFSPNWKLSSLKIRHQSTLWLRWATLTLDYTLQNLNACCFEIDSRAGPEILKVLSKH